MHTMAAMAWSWSGRSQLFSASRRRRAFLLLVGRAARSVAEARSISLFEKQRRMPLTMRAWFQSLVAFVITANAIALGACKENHDRMRPLVAKLMGSSELSGMWTPATLRSEADAFFALSFSNDRTEGLSAFREKRTPDFKGN